MAVTRDEALATLREGSEAMETLLHGLTEKQLTRRGAIGGGEWSARDLVAHLALWEDLALRAVDEWRAGKMPYIETQFRSGDSAIDEINAEYDRATEALSPADVRQRAAETHQRLVDTIGAMSDAEWESKAPYEADRRGRLGSLLGSITGAPKRPFGHAIGHLPDLEAYVRGL
ncbi:MAG: hypothetical protein QOE92_2232 [Chloroflexota bacterium]|jgi:hypothetical protein|nr:hypothetical protein [Chloroflexota bacterium]